MPTNKPKIQIILEKEIYDKLIEMAEKDQRTISQFGGIIITKYVEEQNVKQEKAATKEQLEKSSISRTG